MIFSAVCGLKYTIVW